MPAVSDLTVYTLWWISIGVLFVVVIVAAGLLHAIVRMCQNLDWSVPQVWTDGYDVAFNTIQLDKLYTVVRLSALIPEAALKVNDLAAAIADHAENCHHCPDCASASGVAVATSRKKARRAGAS